MSANPVIPINCKESDWNKLVQYKGTGEYRCMVPSLFNCCVVLQHHPFWKNTLKYDEFAKRTVFDRNTPIGRPSDNIWTDRHDVKFTRWLQENNLQVAVNTVRDAVESVAQDNGFNPLHNYLNDIEHDGESRYYSWPSRYLGVINNQYTRAVGRKWMLAAVARAFDPGCKAENVLILEGPQGKRKSSVFEILGDKFYSVLDTDLSGKEAAILMDGVWIAELSELESLRKSSSGTTKTFFSKATDRYRPVMGKRAIDAKRSTIFGGCTNEEEYLKDHSGGRRFWPLKCGDINLNKLRRDRDNLWAEAVKEYWQRLARDEDYIWWLDPTEEKFARNEQSARFNGDAWYDDVRIFLKGKTDISTIEIVHQCLQITPDNPKYYQFITNVGRCLKHMHWSVYFTSDGRRRHRLES